MKSKRLIYTAALLAFMAGGASIALANNHHDPGVTGTATGATGLITAYNYDDNGGAVNGLWLGTTLLTFSKNVCGGIGSLGVVGNSVTYSGTTETLPSGGIEVDVSAFTNGAITYPPAAVSTRPTAYPLTAGTITSLNYNLETLAIDGFFFTPTTGSPVFVNIGTPSTTLAPLLTVGASVSVLGSIEAIPACSPTGTIAEVDASSLTIGTTVYPIGRGREDH